MTPEDIAQITAIVTASEQRITAIVAASEQRITERLTSSLSEVRLEFIGRLDRAVEALTANLSEVRQELKGLIQPIAHRVDAVEHRLDNFLQTLISIDQRMTALLRQSDRLERDTATTIINQTGQQQAIDQLALRVTKLERELHPEQH